VQASGKYDYRDWLTPAVGKDIIPEKFKGLKYPQAGMPVPH